MILTVFSIFKNWAVHFCFSKNHSLARDLVVWRCSVWIFFGRSPKKIIDEVLNLLDCILINGHFCKNSLNCKNKVVANTFNVSLFIVIHNIKWPWYDKYFKANAVFFSKFSTVISIIVVNSSRIDGANINNPTRQINMLIVYISTVNIHESESKKLMLALI